MCLKPLPNNTMIGSVESGKNNFTLHNDSLDIAVSNSSLKFPTLSISGIIRVAITFTLFILSIAMNGIFLLKLSRQHKKKASRLKLLLDNLMVANLVETIIVMPMDGIWNIMVQWYGGQFLCKVLNFLKLFSMYSPAFMVVVISIDRCLAVTKPLKSATQSTQIRKYMIYTAWLFSFVLALPQLWLFRMIHYSEPYAFSQCNTLRSFYNQWDQTIYNFFTFGFLFVIPLFIMLFCNFKIIFKMMKILRHNVNEISLNRSKNIIPQARMKTLKMTIAFVTSFIICWTPYYLIGIWYWIDPDLHNRLPEPMNHFFFVFGLLNPCFDPLIYGYFSL
ncbi:gonadotropin-releasing hormone receptor [Callorhinchus milii]|uniref:Gonadotropin-releasing hormone receptor n=1 Tax=Callorhinchus milii TaxID=7868 RepID=B2BF84_CALMI|nr:gonadotropin-releasing hormone receptor [Callorhinchus milii]ABU55292.1 type I gonadotropin-releasing hormone receptor [Callorhinchus milii]|eukprot:gi/632949465/ref/XP_007890171.1/ PREDICTED: gonadotropin-releasing hormone receptor [Callorhinchus milii]